MARTPQPRTSRFSPWGELYAQLLRAEAVHHHLTPEQHRENVEKRAAEAVKLLTEAHEANRDRRARVLRHSDLAARVATVLHLAEPSRWNGYIPPRTVEESACPGCRNDRNGHCQNLHGARLNDSPIRAELVAIAAEAWQRGHDTDEGAGGAE